MKREIYIICLLLFIPQFFSFSQDRIYWENPRLLIGEGVYFYAVKYAGDFAVVLWQEFEEKAGGGGETYLSLATSKDGTTWQEKRRFLGPFEYTEKKTCIYSFTLDDRGRIILTLIAEERVLSLYISDDEGLNFRKTDLLTAVPSVSPLVYVLGNGKLLLFVTQEEGENLTIYYLITGDEVFSGDQVPVRFQPFIRDQSLTLNFLPYHLFYAGREYVVFQSRIAAETNDHFQLYLKISEDYGDTWSGEKLITGFKESRGSSGSELLPLSDFTNQRPVLKSLGRSIYVLWERQILNGVSQIYRLPLEVDGTPGTPERITNNSATCLAPRLLSYKDRDYLLWFDNSLGTDRVFLASRDSQWRWEPRDLAYTVEGESRFPEAFFIDQEMFLLWMNEYRGQRRLFLLAPDRTVAVPGVTSPDFRPGGKSNKSWVTFRWNVPEDSSNISGFYYTWSQDPSPATGRLTAVLSDVTNVRLVANRDGPWYFHLMAEDYALNRSAAATVMYRRDTRAPAQVTFVPPEEDEEGFPVSNTFTLHWEQDEGDDDVAGYSYSQQWLGSVETDPESINWAGVRSPGNTIRTTSPSLSFTNLDNGLWVFRVAAIDDVGNVGESASLLLRLNKFIPYTLVRDLIKMRDEYGTDTLILLGRGFSTDGSINTIYLDKDSQPPYDYTFSLTAGDFRIASDRRIDRFSFTDIVGRFRVIIVHDTRGVYLVPESVEFDTFGNLKILPPVAEARPPEYEKTEQVVFEFSVNEILVWLLVMLCGIVILATLFKLLGILQERRQIEAELLAIFRGPGELEWRSEEMKQRIKLKGAGLRLKFTLLMSILVILILMMVSIPLSFYMIRTQRGDLATGLENQVKVLLGSLASSSRDSLSAQDELRLALLPSTARFMEEVQSVTITGIRKKGDNALSGKEYIWATNNSSIGEKIVSPGGGEPAGAGGEVERGLSVLEDEISARLPEIREEINRRGGEELSALQEISNEQRSELAALALKQDAASTARRDTLFRSIDELQKKIEEKLQAISDMVEAVPAYDPNNLQPTYTFFRPIVYNRAGSSDQYFRGMIRVRVSTQNIQETISQSRRVLLTQIIVFALIALAQGILVAIFLASLIIRPLKKLVAAVAFIRDTGDKSELKGHTIEIKQKDEIRMLADTINEMTQGLVKAAVANKDLIVGKETQKMFIPLQKDDSGKKGTTGEEKNDFVEIFGYYEGAKGVSGDYFDFKKLDDKHYCVIKCDVAGKGVPAALIMVEVATIFIDYFRNWNPRAPKIDLPQLVYRMNDLIEERGFKGRFAALTVGIINVKTGVGHFCNAGDKDIHIYNAGKGIIELHQMPEAPASGVFPSMLVEMQSGFKQVTFKANPGDAFFLWTDGLDESKRIFRDENFNIVKCDAPGLGEGDDHGGTHNWGMEDEELGVSRLYAVINAVFNRASYQLQKYHCPVPDEVLSFDFSRCEGTVREAVLAMISVEKIFRIYKSPKMDEESRIVIDKKIDAFLQEHFIQYDSYFTHRQELPDNPGYVVFTHLKEDDQYDDLTLLAIRKL